jgi:hypothetical protein
VDPNAVVAELDLLVEDVGEYEPLIAFPAGRDDEDPVDTLDALIASELFGT